MNICKESLPIISAAEMLAAIMSIYLYLALTSYMNLNHNII